MENVEEEVGGDDDGAKVKEEVEEEVQDEGAAEDA
jgi:hypothetical protein